MSVVALGLDLARIDRIEQVIARRGRRFLERVFTEQERAYCDARRTAAASYAGRFAVKEAVMKMLGTGWARGVRWVDIEVAREPGQAPRVQLSGAAAAHARRLGIAHVLVSITHDAGIAAAVAIGESAADGVR